MNEYRGVELHALAVLPFFDRRQPPRPPLGADGIYQDPILAALEGSRQSGGEKLPPPLQAANANQDAQLKQNRSSWSERTYGKSIIDTSTEKLDVYGRVDVEKVRIETEVGWC